MLGLGPILIVTVMVIVGCETYWTVRYILPSFAAPYCVRWGASC